LVDELKFYPSLEKVIVISGSFLIKNINKTLEEEDATFLIIEHNLSIYLLSKDMLEILEMLTEFEGKEKLLDLIKDLPSLIVTDKPIDSLNIKDLEQYFEIINETNAEGIIFFTDNKMSGVLSGKTIIKYLGNTNVKTFCDFHGGRINSVVQGFICRKCSPPSYRFPREGDNPICPKNPLHGRMDNL
jgi:hypothetical protein